MIDIPTASMDDPPSFSVIPRPSEVVPADDGGSPFVLTEATYIACDAAARGEADLLSEFLEERTGLRPAVREAGCGPSDSTATTAADGGGGGDGGDGGGGGGDSGTVILMILDGGLGGGGGGRGEAVDGDESYELTASSDAASIRSPSRAGLMRAAQTVRQLMRRSGGGGGADGAAWSMPAGTVRDRPRFRWRGMHLDVGRHLFPVSFVKRYVDLMALHKFNVFHWHLTEDQGWRIEIDGYPKLTSTSAWRDGTPIPSDRDRLDGIRYGGFYTKEEVRDVVSYAAARHVCVVPEIEMPGHTVAVLAAYPELGCAGGGYEVRCHWGVEEDVFCAGNDDVFTFLGDVLAEVFELFPDSEFVHIGGDECPKGRWRACDKCQERMKREGLADEGELQSYFVRRVEEFVHANGRRLIGWDEILEGGLPARAAVMSWRGTGGGIAAANAGHDVVMTPTAHCYLDYYQSRHGDGEPPAIGGYLPLSKAYEFEPAEGVPAESRARVMGGQGNVWTEYMPTPGRVEYMAYPRACALAESLWSRPEKRHYRGFRRRLEGHFDLLDSLGVNYRRPRESDDDG